MMLNAKKRTYLCVFGIAISIMLIFSLIQMGEFIVDGYNKAIMNTANFDCYYKNLNRNIADKMYEKYMNTYMVTETAYIASVKEGSALNHQVVGVRGEWKKLFMTELIEGYEPTKSQDICLEKSYARDKNLKVGDELLLNVEVGKVSQEKDFVVSGIVEDLPNYSPESRFFVSMNGVDYILGDFLIKEESEGNYYVDYILISQEKLPSSEKLGEIGYEIYETFGKEIGQAVVFNEHRTELRDNDGNLYSGVRIIIGIVILFIAIATIFFIYYMIRMNFMSRIQQYGILQSVGCGMKGLKKILLLEIAVYGIAGYTLGCFMGVLLNLVVAKFFVKTFVGLEINKLYLTVKMLFYVFVILIISLSIGYLLFFFSVRKMKPIDFLRGKNEKCEMKKFKNNNIFLELTLNNCLRNKKIYRGMVISMVLALGLIVLLGNGMGAVSFDVQKTAPAFAETELCIAPDFDLLLEGKGFDATVTDTLRNSCEEVYFIALQRSYKACDADEGEIVANILIYSNNLMEKLKKFQHIKSNAKVIGSFSEKKFQSDKLVIQNEIDKFEIEIDDYVDFGMYNLAGEAIPGDGFIIMDEDYAKELFGEIPNYMDAYLGGSRLSREQLVLLCGNRECFVYDLSNIQQTLFSQVKTLIILVGYMMIAMLLLVVFMITTVVRQNFENRKKEIGMLLAIGIRRRLLKSILCVEMYIMLGIACMIAALGSLPISVYIFYVINQKVGIGWLGYTVGMPVTCVLFVVLVSGSVNHCLKEKLLDLIRED